MPTRNPNEAAVRVRRLNHCFGREENRKQVLYDIDLDLMPGEIIIMTGPSGSGKTTLLTLMGALRSVRRGASWRSAAISPGSAHASSSTCGRGIGFIFQAHNLFDSLTARENVNMAIELTLRDARERDRRATRDPDRAGTRERMAHKPQTFPAGRSSAWPWPARWSIVPNRFSPTSQPPHSTRIPVVTSSISCKALAEEEKATILIVTHDTRILDVADRIINLVDGRILSDVAVKQALLISEFLQRCPLFAGQPAAMLAEFAERMRRESFQAGAAIIRQGEIGDKFYLIGSGVVDVSGEKEAPASRASR